VLGPQIADSVLQGHELAHFGVGERAVEDGEVVKVADVGGAEHELRRIRLPAEREIPVLNRALKLAVDPQATGGPGRLVVGSQG
jgi:hypothetical protein